MGQSNRQKTKILMMKALSALFFSACVLPATALDLGRLQILSAIGEPLRAEIEVAQASSDELRTLRAQLASPGAFAQAGMEFNPALNGVTASLQIRANGAPFIVLNGRAPIQENFIDLILETQSSTGKLIKNYALLLNSVADRVASGPTSSPPSTNNRVLALPVINQEPAPISPSVTPFRTNETSNPLNATSVELNAKQIPVYRFAPVDNAQAPITNVRSIESNRTTPTSNLKAPAVQATPKVMGQTSLKGDKTIKVKTGDTASRLALRFLGPNVSLDQMMLAMLEANPDAFIQGNVNLIKAGAVLRIPEAEEATQIPQTQARKIVIAQSIEFAEYAKRLAESPLLVDSENSRVMSGKVTTESGKTETPTPQQDKLTLSKSSVGSTAAEAIIARDREAKDTTDQLAALNKNLKDLEALAKNPSASNSPTTSLTTTAAAMPTPGGGTSETMSQLTTLSGSYLKDLTENKQLWAWTAALLAALFFVALWMRKNSSESESIYAPSYDDAPSPSMGPAMGTGSSQVNIPAQMRSIDLNLQSQANDIPLASHFINPEPQQAVSPATQPAADDTEQIKLNLAAQLSAKGDNELAQTLLLSVISSTHGDIKGRAIQMLGQIR